MKLELKIPPVANALIIAAAMWWIALYLDLSWAVFDTKWWGTVFFLGLGGAFGLLGLVEFYKESTSINPHKPDNTSSLVTNGIYSISRNPMYAGLLLILVGFGFYLGNVLVFAMIPIFVAYMNRYQIAPEEQVMDEKFGDEYQKYKAEVRRWF